MDLLEFMELGAAARRTSGGRRRREEPAINMGESGEPTDRDAQGMRDQEEHTQLPTLVEYSDSDGDDEATDDSVEKATNDSDRGKQGGETPSAGVGVQDDDDDPERTQSMGMDDVSAMASSASLDGLMITTQDDEDVAMHEKERNAEPKVRMEREVRAIDGVGGGHGGEQTKAPDKGKRRLPNWMVLTPTQLQQAQEEKEREMRQSKDVLREQAVHYFDIMQTSTSIEPEPSEPGYRPPALARSQSSLCVVPEARPLTETETKVSISETLRYTEVHSPIEEGRVIVFDLETSGFGAEDSIIEIGAVELVDGQRTGIVFQSYARALTSINPYAFKAHGLSEDFLSHHQSIEAVLNNFMRWVGTSPLVAHNIRFDIRMLCQELRRWDIPLNDNKIFCTLRYYRTKYPGMAYSLDDLASRFQIDRIIERRTHGALIDAEICTRVYQKLMDALC